MKKQETKQVEKHELYEFEDYCNLFNIFNGGRGLEFLRKIVDSIQADNYSNPCHKLPSILLVGQGINGAAKMYHMAGG